MDDMRNEYEAMKLVPKVTLKDMFVNATLRIPLMIAMMVMVAQQLSGINAVSVNLSSHTLTVSFPFCNS
jgi:SP family facilitated glucose transporter-like MFS transporter 1